ncbi:hypothetical protein BVRB_4g078440 [Beta vulgaris subsp. vulgaris]|nr:hypothetical protein BVRB_4g078440 [Beta vulgaris subsp. vulgaris]
MAANHQESKFLVSHHEDYNLQQKKKTGKRKIEIKPITNKPSKQVTFSKRKSGLFKKAGELSSLCGAEVAVITISAAGKLFSFGHPTPDATINRYVKFSARKSDDISNNNNVNVNNGINVDKLSEQYKEVLGNIELEKRRTAGASSSSNGDSPRGDINSNEKLGFCWDNVPTNDLGIIELERLKVALEGLRVEVSSKIEAVHHCSSTSLFHPKLELGSCSNENGVAQGYEDFGWINNNNNDHVLVRDQSIQPLLLPMNTWFGYASENYGNFSN